MAAVTACNPYGTTNRPIWTPQYLSPGQGHQEVWYLKMNDAAQGHALWLRFTLLIRKDGSKRVAEVWAIDFQHGGEEPTRKVGIKNTHDIRLFESLSGEEEKTAFRINDCHFGDDGTCGEVRSDEHTIRWDFQMALATEGAFDFVPVGMRRAGIVKNTAVNVFEDLRFTGWSETDGERTVWENAPGMQGHLAGAKNGHSWVWGHCNTFVNEAGEAAPLLWDGLSARARLGSSMASPLISTLFCRYQGQDYGFNTVWDALRTPSSFGLTEWRFRAAKDGLVFEGAVHAREEDFAGVTYEDTDGSALYCYNSKISDMEMRVLRNGKLEGAFVARGTAAFEYVTRTTLPGIPLVI